MKVVTKNRFFGELNKLCKPEMGFIPKSAVVEAFNNVSFEINKEQIKKPNITTREEAIDKLNALFEEIINAGLYLEYVEEGEITKAWVPKYCSEFAIILA